MTEKKKISQFQVQLLIKQPQKQNTEIVKSGCL